MPSQLQNRTAEILEPNMKIIHHNRLIRPTFAALSLVVSLAGCDASKGYSGGDTLVDGEQDPVVEDFPLVYVQRPLPRVDAEEDPDQPVRPFELIQPADFNPGAKLIFRNRASMQAPQINVTDRLFLSDNDDHRELPFHL